VKFTTGTTISVPKREREALLDNDRNVVGVVAALFWCGKRDIDGRWFIVDAAESFRSGKTEGGSLGVQDLRRIEKSQPWLGGVRKHVERMWPPFLCAFGELALAGHKALQAELREEHRVGKLGNHLGDAAVLDMEHRRAVQAIVETHGTSMAGHIFQDLLAYLLGLAGYQTIRTNPVGVPDIAVSGLIDAGPHDRVTLDLSRPQVETLIRLARKAGEAILADKLELRIANM